MTKETKEPTKAKKAKELRDEVTCFRVPKRLKADVRFHVAKLIDKIIEEDKSNEPKK
jgi:hypothetical protein